MTRLIPLFLLLTTACATAAVPEQTIYETKTCNGATVGFSVTGTITAATDVKVILVNTTTTPYTTTVLTNPTHYSVTVANGRYPATAFTVTTVSTYSSDYRLVITTDVDLASTLSISSSDREKVAIQRAIERLTVMVQELDRKISQTVRNPEAIGLTPTTTLPEYGSSGFLYRSAAGNVSVASLATDPNYPTMSSYWQDIVQESDLASTLPQMGFGDGYTNLVEWGNLDPTVGDAGGAGWLFQWDPDDEAWLKLAFGEAGEELVQLETAAAVRTYLNVDTVFNVKAYGAVGNGVANDTAAIQAAIDAAEAAGGGTAYLPPGNYYISAALEMSSSITLQGAGAGATTILHGNDNGIELPASSWYVRLEDFSIKPLTTIADVSYACIYIGSGSRNFSFKRLTIGATSSGHSHPDYGVLSDSTAAGSTYMGKFEEVYTRRCRESGVSLIQSYDCSFDRCQFIAYECTSNVVLKGAGNTFTNCMFSGSPIGLTLWGFSNTFVGCNFELENSGCGLDSYCVLLKYDAGGNYTQARGNRFLGGTWDMSAPAETASSAYVQIEGTARDNLFVVGRWLDTTGDLVRLNGSAYGNSFVGSEIVWPDVIVQESGDEAYNAQTTANGALHLYGTYTYNNGLTVKNGSTSAGYINLYEDSDNGTNYVRLIGPASTGNGTLTLPTDTEIGQTGVVYNTAGTLTTAEGLTISGGSGTLGADGATQGTLTLWDGAGGNTPGYIKIHSPNGTAWYLFVEDDGTIKVHNAAPTQNSDGSAVGGQS